MSSMEALMERIRSRVDLSKTLLDTAKTVRIGLADKRHSLDIEVGILGGLNLFRESGVGKLNLFLYFYIYRRDIEL